MLKYICYVAKAEEQVVHKAILGQDPQIAPEVLYVVQNHTIMKTLSQQILKLSVELSSALWFITTPDSVISFKIYL